jgi:hypothetical protein
MANQAWLTAMLCGTAFNDPKKFPKSPEELLKAGSPKAFNKSQWAAVISALTGGNKEKPKKPKYPPLEVTKHGN